MKIQFNTVVNTIDDKNSYDMPSEERVRLLQAKSKTPKPGSQHLMTSGNGFMRTTK